MVMSRYDKGVWIGEFQCMASPCELLIEVDEQLDAFRCMQLVENEARRIERKFSRYRDDNIVAQINTACGEVTLVDEETALLLDFSRQCFDVSDGLFDITSGVLREVWHFDGGDRLPVQEDVDRVLDRVGWNKVDWQAPHLRMPDGMQIDLGGIGKEYAVDRAVELLLRQTQAAFLINFGGDLRASGRRKNGQPWHVGVEDPVTLGGAARAGIAITQGALATSGDSRRFLMKDGKRYSHILDPRTGWPVEQAPRSVTVAGPTAVEAGMMATLASLQGAEAEAFLQAQNVRYWIIS